MYLTWGSYSFQTRKTWLDWLYTPVFSQRGFLMYYKLNARFGGTVSSIVSVSDLETKMTALETAMRTQNQDFILKHEGSNASSLHSILAADTMDGTQMQFGWMKGTAKAIRGNSNEYINLRTYQGMVTCLINACEEAVPVWEENIRQVGAGTSQIVVQESLTGVPLGQAVQAATMVMIIQEGHGIGWADYPAFPDSQFPSGFSAKNAIYEKGSPIFGRNATRMFPIRWRYVHELVAAPTAPVSPTPPPALSPP